MKIFVFVNKYGYALIENPDETDVTPTDHDFFHS